MTPAIVVLGYERPDALQRLLDSLARALYPPETAVPLLISLDCSTSEAGARTSTVAHDFQWVFGPKQVIAQPEHLGVVGHFRVAGALTHEHGDIILLEDDLTVSPAFYDATCQVLDAYRGDERIGGFCLYGLWFNGFTQEPFLPLEDGGDVFFLRVPYTQGLCFSAAQWAAYERWQQDPHAAGHSDLHPAFSRFGADEWFPSLASYIAHTGRFFCFPRTSLTTGWGDAGAHFAAASSWFQTPLLMGRRRFNLPSFDDALAVYDGFFELLPERLRRLAPALQGLEFDVDTNATKPQASLSSEFVLTSRPSSDAQARFGLRMYPPELNVAMQVPGDDLVLARREHVRWDTWAETDARRRVHAYYWRRHRPSRMRDLRFIAAEVMERLRARRSAR